MKESGDRQMSITKSVAINNAVSFSNARFLSITETLSVYDKILSKMNEPTEESEQSLQRAEDAVEFIKNKKPKLIDTDNTKGKV